MKRLILLLMIFSYSSAFAKPVLERVEESSDWSQFESAMIQARIEDQQVGMSYLISGGLVALGGMLGSQTANDSTSKFVFGLSESLGIAGMGYGIAKLSYGNEYNSLYDAIHSSKLSEEQKNSLVRVYLQKEKEKRESIKRVSFVTHLLLTAVNLYAATQEKDANSKTFFQFFAGANLALALAYTF